VNDVYLPEEMWPLPENTAIIAEYKHNRTAIVAVAGNTDADTRKAALVIANFTNYNLDGDCFLVNTLDENNLLLEKCNLSNPIIQEEPSKEEGPTNPKPKSSGESGGGGGGASVPLKTTEFEDGTIDFEGKLKDTLRFMIDGNSHTIR
jgi:hypothetical protein